MINQKEDITKLLGNSYVITKQLGQGAFATIYYAINKNNQQVAIKCTSISKIIGKQRNPQAKELKRQLLESEAKIMKDLKKYNNQNIVKCYDVVKNQNYQILVLEYCNKGSLYDKIQSEGKIKEHQAINILSQLLRGFAGMHKQRVIHRDIKAENILIHNNTYKLADFGLSKNVNQLTKAERGTILGTRCTIAPEVIRSQQYSSQADIWSIGVVFYEMLTGKLPFNNIINDEQIKKLQNSLKQQQMSQQSKKLFKKLFVINPSQRLQWKEFYKMLIDQTGIFSRNQSYINTNSQKKCSFEIEFPKIILKQNISTNVSCSQNLLQNQLLKIHLSKEQFQCFQPKILLSLQKSQIIKQKIIFHLYDFDINTYKLNQNTDKNTQSKLLFLLFTQCIYLLQKFNDFICLKNGKAGKFSSLRKINNTINKLNQQLQNLYNLRQRFGKFSHKPEQEFLTKYFQYKCQISQHIQKVIFYSNIFFKKQTSIWSWCLLCFGTQQTEVENYILYGYQKVVRAQNFKSLQQLKRG